MASRSREVERAVGDRADAADILERFHELGSTRPTTDGKWIAPAAVPRPMAS